MAIQPPETTDDSIFHGRLSLRQNREGYRFTEDALILAAFAARSAAEITVDLGAGCGVVGLALLSRRATSSLIAVEIGEEPSRLIRYNGLQNGLDSRVMVLRSDLRSLPVGVGAVDLVVSNPPYLKLGRGRLPDNEERALARHEVACSPETLCRSAARCLVPGGRLVVVYPVNRLDDVRGALHATGLRPSRVRMVHPRPDEPPSLFLMEARQAGTGATCDDEPPLCSHERDGGRGEEMERILGGDW